MSDLRTDPINKFSVVVAPERNKRPKDSFNGITDNSKTCPFCPGNEDQTPPESYRINDNYNNWIIRAFPNKYPAFTNSTEQKISGYQEVLVETVNHSQNMGLYSIGQLIQLVGAYKNRIQELKKRKKTQAIILFKNHGVYAGATLEHPHSQIVALDFIPHEIEFKQHKLKEFYVKNNECYFCSVIKKEQSIYESQFFKVIVPANGRFSYETWIIPKKHFTYSPMY